MNPQESETTEHRDIKSPPIILLTPPLRLTLGLGLVVSLLGCLWAIFAKIPITVNGTGILLPVNSSNTILSPDEGIAYWVFDQSPPLYQHLAWRFRNQPESFTNQEVVDLAMMLNNYSIRLAAKYSNTAKTTDHPDNLKIVNRSARFAQGRLLLWILSAERHQRIASSLEEVRRSTLFAKKESDNLLEQQRLLNTKLKSRIAYLTEMKKQEALGYVTRTSILEQESQVDNLRSQVLDINNELLKISSNLSTVNASLRANLSELIGKSLVFATSNLFITDIIPNNGDTVSAGQTLMQTSTIPLDSPTYIPVFLSNRDFSQVFLGMPVLATPSGYKRAEVGGIRGRVVAISKLPSSLQEIIARVGAGAIAQPILSQYNPPSLVVVELERDFRSQPRNHGGYQWSSKSPLPFPPKGGDTLNVEITTRLVAPISLVLPDLKEVFGIAPPEPHMRAPSNQS